MFLLESNGCLNYQSEWAIFFPHEFHRLPAPALESSRCTSDKRRQRIVKKKRKNTCMRSHGTKRLGNRRDHSPWRRWCTQCFLNLCFCNGKFLFCFFLTFDIQLSKGRKRRRKK